MLDERFIEETHRLRRAWTRRLPEDLAQYLVRDVEDPRINVQSILTRHFLIERLFGDRHLALMGEELRFAAVMNWLLKRAHDFGRPDRVGQMLDALFEGHEQCGPITFPPFVLEAYRNLPLGEPADRGIAAHHAGARGVHRDQGHVTRLTKRTRRRPRGFRARVPAPDHDDVVAIVHDA